PDNSDVLDDKRCRGEVVRLRLRAKSGPEVHLTLVSKALDHLAGFRIYREQVRRTNRKNPFVGTAAPVGNTTRRCATQGFLAGFGQFLHPKRLTGRRIEGLD